MEDLLIFYDTETTGIPYWENPSGGDDQPHIVHLAAILADANTRDVVQTLDLIVKPDGWVIPEETTDLHGITTEYAMEVGDPEEQVLDSFLTMWSGHARVAHNRTFDQRIIRIAAKRYADEETVERWANKDSHLCTGLLAKPIMKMGHRGRYGYKMPKLAEAYKYFTGKDLENAHTAMADAEACMTVYWAIEDLKSMGATA